MAINELVARVKLKRDIAANWDNPNSDFIPLEGELIIYSPDSTHSYARLKVGDGVHMPRELEFIDSGSVNGKIMEDVIQIYDTMSEFPGVGDDSNSLYVSRNTSNVYYWNGISYSRLGGVTYTPAYITMKGVGTFDSGTLTTARAENHTLIITQGTLSTLSLDEQTVVTRIDSN